MGNKVSKNTLAMVFIASTVLSGAAAATEYIYRDIAGNSPPNPKCVDKQVASQRASDPYYIHRAAKTFCEVQGYGWHLTEALDNGNLVCDECTTDSSQGLYQCHMQDVVVKCQRIRPGSVGMLPGKG